VVRFRRGESVVDPTFTLVDGRYHVIRELGRGGMAIVYLAHDTGLDRSVALKVILPELGADPAFVAQFQREARALAALRNPNIVAVHAFGRFEQSHFFVMEHVRGTSLETVIEDYASRRERVPLQRALTILKDTASGLAAVHGADLVHRDVKPGNIIIEEDSGRPVLVDFGLADGATQSGVIGGTPEYCPAEQLRGAPSSPQSDVYALGVLAFEILTGRLPFDASSLSELTHLHAHVDAPLLSSVVPNLQPLDHIIARMVQKDATRRYPNAGAVLRDLVSASGRFNAAAPRATRPVVARGVGRVMLVDPTPPLRKVLQRAIETTFFWQPTEVDSVATCQEATTLAAADRPDMLVFGFNVPHTEALALLNELRARPDGGGIRVILLTGEEELRSTRVRFAALGVRDFMLKPVDMRELCDVLKAAASRSGLFQAVKTPGPSG
jgi:CheY-like chemotaxis protein